MTSMHAGRGFALCMEVCMVVRTADDTCEMAQ